MKPAFSPHFNTGRLHTFAYLAIAGFCSTLAWKALATRFASDDMMNLHYYWSHGFGNVLWHNLFFWTTDYRPAGGLYYLPLYNLFGLDPTPYRIAILAIIVANAYLTCVTAELLTGSRVAAVVTGILAAAHRELVPIYLLNSYIYDVLSYFFMQVVLIGHIRVRKRGLTPGWGQSLWLTAAFITALNDKEISAGIANWECRSTSPYSRSMTTS